MNPCSVCKGFFLDSECVFANKKGRTLPVVTCRKCNNERCKKQYQKRKEYYIDLAMQRRAKNRLEARKYVLQYYMTHSCVDCGENDYMVLQFDHVGAKRSGVGRMVSCGYPIRTIMKEISGCEVRCVNCHKRKTARDQKWYKDK